MKIAMISFMTAVACAMKMRKQLANEIENLEKTFQIIDDISLICSRNENELEALKDELMNICANLWVIYDHTKKTF